ncbi:N-acetylmannosamine-6-phosphate 2-epimerase [Jiangella alba]|uniref:Putative N-acetylmannosamine-6-phosphate 2-epimerase n=1 Tax=Jiangella alba TaxID=561176 RepID=A0A1H5PY90_9ACTN|nr:N-acetylmannosamine-6-phosphate 2-epimerase [Jiangella alba]SEF18833.1 N-acylglucosamine-6-phosphate 2-epimerase [Jiangella alba]
MTGAVLDRLRGGLIVSCQAYPGEPMRDPATMARIAHAVATGGAAAVRLQGPDDIRAAAPGLGVPVVGIWKDGDGDVVITPTLRHALAVAEAGAGIVAVDGTRRPRPDGRTLAATVAGLRERADVTIMADCGSIDDALAAQDAGVDVLATTLAGYTPERARGTGPDLELLDAMAGRCTLPVVAEGRFHTPAQAREALARGAWAVCVGTAITHPETITRRFRAAMVP